MNDSITTTAVEETTATKICQKCGRELPDTAEHFYMQKGRTRPVCKECFKSEIKKKRVQKQHPQDELSVFTCKELIAELRARGYKGTLTFTQKIEL